MRENRTTFIEMSERIRRGRTKAKMRERRAEDNMIKKLLDSGRARPINRGRNNFHGDCDHPGTIENGTATFFWIISLLIGALFKGAWVIWIVTTIIWWKFITRHNK